MNHQNKYSTKQRYIFLLLGVIGLSICLGGYILTPRPDDFTLCSFRMVTGLPCPLCGVTTSFIYTVHGKIKKAFNKQPFGLFLYLEILITSLSLLFIAVTGKFYLKKWPHLLGKIILYINILFAGLVWIWQILLSIDVI